MKPTDRVTIPEHVMVRQVGDESVMLDLASGTYFGLDAIGARVWQLLVEGRTLAETCDAMLEEYEVSREELERDVADLVEQLAAQGLLVPA